MKYKYRKVDCGKNRFNFAFARQKISRARSVVRLVLGTISICLMFCGQVIPIDLINTINMLCGKLSVQMHQVNSMASSSKGKK